MKRGTTLKPQEFIENWKAVELKERSASQSHFNDLCRLLGIDKPTTADPKGEWFTFEKGASKTSGGEGWADVWRKDCFAWEYKGKRKNLDAAFDQLLRYSVALDHPPLLIVSDMDRILIHTNWTNTVQKVYTITLDELLDATKRDILRNAFLDPERLKPDKTRQVLTEDAAKKFSCIAQRLRDRKHDAHTVAHFVNRLVFCMFAEDVGLLPNKMFERMLSHCLAHPEDFETHAKSLFGAMKSGGMVGFERVEWFNGGLFDDDSALPLERGDIAELQAVAAMDWSDIDPSILGTLFERGLDPAKRSQLGAHYTDRDKIMQIVEPVIVRPLLAEWEGIKTDIAGALDAEQSARKKASTIRSPRASGLQTRKANKAHNTAERLYSTFIERLRAFRVLDPACGSGNFLYLSLLALKDLEHRVNLEAESLGLPRRFPSIGPECVKGIEINPYAAELARVSVWIGEIQWMRRNGFEASKNPILRPLGTIECRDAVLNPNGTKAEWPNVDVVVGNPPFLGAYKMSIELGLDYVEDLRGAWPEVPGAADFVTYWFAKAWEQMKGQKLQRVGLVATNSIRGGASRELLKPIVDKGRIFCAYSDESWTVDGAAVRVSMICFDTHHKSGPVSLDGEMVEETLSDLTGSMGFDLTSAKKLAENKGVCIRGIETGGPFEIDHQEFTYLINEPTNPNGLPNSKVLWPVVNGSNILKSTPERYVIDFSNYPNERDAALFEAPFSLLQQRYKDYVTKSKRKVVVRKKWWLHRRSGEALRRATENLARKIVTPRVGKYRVFVFVDGSVFADSAAFVIGRDDETTFGILHSRFHEIWALRMGTFLGVGNDPRYTPSTTFETFPFPDGLTPNVLAANYAANPHAQAIAAAAARLNELRENWLNPPDLVDRVPEVAPGFPDRILPKDNKAAKELKKRTLTNLYNARPAWLDHAHRALDEAIAEAYGWGNDWRAGDLTDDEILARLFQLNQERAAKQDK